MKAPPEVVFAQNLASNDKIIRDRAVKKLKKWLGSRSINGKYVSEDEMMKIWKGLHYCYWMSDKPLIQEELADNIANIVSCFKHEESSVYFFKCFLVTIGREWFGIDRLRMDKFMMLVRRCLRQALAFVKDNKWDVALVEKLTAIVKQDVMLAEPRDTSLGFQLHVADVFLEELAKIGADSVNAETVTVFLQPFIEVLVSGKEDRLRDHVAERIFHHLIRQSDPGIEWAVQEEMGDADFNGDEDLEEDMEEEKDDDEEEDIEDDLAVDPRAGGVDVTLPQIQVDYQGLAKLLFDLGSGTDVRKANRELLYKLSKNFKDVTQEVFPLGADIDLDQDIEKISVKKAAKRLEKFNDDYHKVNLENKIAFKAIVKEQKNKLVNEKSNLENGETGEANGCVNSDDLANGNSTQNGLKRSSEEESDDEPVEKKSKADEKDETGEKFDYKEKRKKQKQEQKKRKRERKAKEEAEKAQKEKKAQLLLETDLNFKIALDGEKKSTGIKSTDSEGRLDTPAVANGDTTVIQNENDQTVAAEIELLGKKKQIEKKKKLKNADVAKDDNPTNAQSDLQSSESIVKIKKKKKKEKSSKEHKNVSDKIDAITEDVPVSETEDKIAKKKKIKDKFNDLAKGTVTEESLVGESDTTGQDESCSATEIVKKKKKKKKEKQDKPIHDDEEQSAKVFEESDWDSPLKPGETEIVLPNKKYKGKDKLKSANEAQCGFPGFDPPSITKTTPKTSGTTTASFLKKAMSKSASPKLKKSKIEKIKKLETLTMSEPKKKKVNFALTMNKSQDINAFITSIASSPSIPHDPNKQPSKPLLSGQDSTPNSSKRNSVALNTQINSKSKIAKKMAALSKRGRAMDFF